MATTDQMKKDMMDYEAQFAEEGSAPVEVTEDEAFGITPEAPVDAVPVDGAVAEGPPAEMAPEGAAAPAAEVVVGDDTAVGGEPGGQTAMESSGDSDTLVEEQSPRDGGDGGVSIGMAKPGEASVMANEAVESQAQTVGADGSPMTEQQLRSWQGRLKKAQSDLDAKAASGAMPASDSGAEAPAVDALEAVAEGAAPELAAAADSAADMVEAGTMTADQAMKQLAEDFGEDFVKMIEVIASAKAREAGMSVASEKVGEVGRAVEDIISHISDRDARAHFEQIEAAHPDFRDVGMSEGFRMYVDALAEPNKAEAMRIANGGSAKEINNLLSTYKASMTDGEGAEQAAAPAADPVVEASMDAAEGVRSAGMSLPEQPAAAADGYEAAWEEFNKKS